MNVNRHLHALSSSHREPGGLRLLGFVLDRVAAWSRGRAPDKISALIVDDPLGSIALPCAARGYRVALLDSATARVEDVRRVAKELNLNLEAITLTRKETTRMFDVIVAPHFLGTPKELALLLKDKQISIAPRGGILLVGLTRPKNMTWPAYRQTLREAGLRLRAMTVAGVMGVNRKSRIFRMLDRLDHWASSYWPIKLARNYLLELEPCHPRDPYVIHLMPSLGRGGAERVVFDLASHLPARHFQAKAVAMIEGGPLEELFRSRGTPVEVVKRRDPFGLSTLRDLRRLFLMQRPDIVHTHLFGADAWGRLAAWLAGVPHVVSTEHNINPSYGLIKRCVNRLFARRTDVFIAVSKAVKRDMVRQRLPAKKIQVIHNGIDLERVIPRGPHPFHDIPRLICVARLYPQKDHATLLKALALIERPWRLRLVGTGPLKRELGALAERLHIASRLEWLGNREDVPELLAKSDIFCLPSRWEGLGLAALEAAAAGVPVVLSDLAPLHEVLDDNDARFIPPGDVAAWSEALRETLDDSSAALARAIRARSHVLARASIETMVDGYARVYRRIMKLEVRRLKVEG